VSGAQKVKAGPRGNPQAKNLFAVVGYLQKNAGLHLRVASGALAEDVTCRPIANGGLRCANPPDKPKSSI